jgi:hypothetical protein
LLGQVKLGQLADVTRGNNDISLRTDDILIRRVSGSIGKLGEPVMIESGRTPWPGSPDTYIHIRVSRVDVLFPRYLYYLLQHLNQSGQFQRIAQGSVQQFIRVRDVEAIALRSA